MRSLQSDVEQRGTRIFELVDKHPERLFSKTGFYQRLMALSMHDERFKTQLFRFVAVLPSLRRSSEIIQHLQEYFSGSNDGFSPLVGMGVRAARLVPWISAPVLRWNVSEMARQFIAGRNSHEVIATLRKRRAQKIGFTVDVLGEAVVSEAEADEYAAIYGDLLEKLARETRDWTDPLGKNAELFPIVNLSVKISALVFTNQSGCSGGCDCPPQHQAPRASSPRPGAGRIYQFRHGELRAQKYDSRVIQNHFNRAGVQRLASCRDCHPGLSTRFRGRPARFDRVGSRTRHSLRSPTGERRILGLRDNEIGPERIESSGLSSEA